MVEQQASTALPREVGPASPLTLEDLLGVLRRKLWLINFVTTLVIAVAVTYSLRQTPSYQATAEVLLRTRESQQLFPSVGSSQFFTFNREPEAELDFARSDAFTTAARQLPSGGAPVSVSSPSDTSRLRFTANSPTPEAAVAAANAWASAYVTERQASGLADLRSSIEITKSAITDLELEKADVLAPLQPIDRAIASTDDPEVISGLTTQRLILEQSFDDELLPIQVQLRTLATDLADMEIAADLLGRDDVSARVARQANNAGQTAPNPARDIGAAAVLGLALAVGLAVLVDSLRKTVLDSSDVARAVPDIPVLAELPRLRTRRKKRRIEPVDSTSPYSEALERLVTTIGLLHRGSHDSRLLVTSPEGADGKTTLVANLATRMAHQGLDVITIDADLRRPRLAAAFGVGLDDSVGLSAVLDGSAELYSSLQRLNDPFIIMLGPGPPVPNPASLLRLPGSGVIFDKLAGEADLVLLDSAPVLPVTDTEAIAAVSNADVIMVARAGKTTRAGLATAIARVEATRALVSGVVLVDTKTKTRSSYYYSSRR